MKALETWRAVTLATVLVCALAGEARAVTINNGGFESGFSSWTRVDQVGSDGGFSSQTGNASPVNGFSVAAPPEGATAAMTDQQGPGAHALYQDFLVDASANSRFIKFSLYLNSGFEFTNPGSLDFATPSLNQQARVDIMTASADPFSVAGGDVLQTLFQTQSSDPLESGYTSYLIDVTSLLQAHQGQTLRLRFAEVDNVSFLNFGVDDVGFVEQTTGDLVPEPSSLALAASGLLPLLSLTSLRRRRRVPAA
ncbi:MAG: PEP-CTERM sorting domain-containing protein [Actinomycetota bacterium]